MENNITFPIDENGENNENYFNKMIPNLVLNSLKSGHNSKHRQYDAILIDEGQDYAQSYYDVLCAFLSDNDEVLFVTDEKQNIYSRKLSWIDNMKGTKFRGRWRELKESYRLPLPILKEANRFAKLFLPEIGLVAEPVNKQLRMELSSDNKLINAHLIWRNLHINDNYQQKIFNAYSWLTEKQNIHPSEIVILVSTHKEGMDLVNMFGKYKIKVNHVFENKDDNKSTYKNKHSFWMGDSRLKISTIHSFKGWELLNVIVLTPSSDIKENMDSLMYIAITRARENLIVFNRFNKYRDYGSSWTKTW
jgi:superfamily I DNA/RNA helicase